MVAVAAQNSPTWLKVSVCISIWWTCAVTVTLGVRALLAAHGEQAALYPFPFALTALMNGCTALVAGSVELARSWRSRCGGKLSFNEALALGSIGLLQGIEIGCGTKALEFLTVAKRTMVMSTSLLFVMMTAVPFGLEELSCGKLGAAGLLTVGGCLQGLSTWQQQSVAHAGISDSSLGYLMAVLAMVLSSLRWALLQHLLQRARLESWLRQITKLRMLACIMPVTSLVCSLMAAVFETNAFAGLTRAILQRIVIMSLLLTVMCTSEFYFVQMTSAVAMNVAGQLHNIPIVLSGVAFFNETIHPASALGFSLCILGALLYTSERRARGGDSRMVENEIYTLVGQDDHEMDQLVDPQAESMTAKDGFSAAFAMENPPMASDLQTDRRQSGLSTAIIALSLPDKANLYAPLMKYPQVVRVVALSGGYDEAESNKRLAANNGMIASFSRVLREGLHKSQSDEEFHKTLANTLDRVNEASQT